MECQSISRAVSSQPSPEPSARPSLRCGPACSPPANPPAALLSLLVSFAELRLPHPSPHTSWMPVADTSGLLVAGHSEQVHANALGKQSVHQSGPGLETNRTPFLHLHKGFSVYPWLQISWTQFCRLEQTAREGHWDSPGKQKGDHFLLGWAGALPAQRKRTVPLISSMFCFFLLFSNFQLISNLEQNAV